MRKNRGDGAGFSTYDTAIPQQAQLIVSQRRPPEHHAWWNLTNPPEHDTLSDKVHREWQLLQQSPNYITDGLQNRITQAVHDKPLTFFEVGSSVALATGLTYLTHGDGFLADFAKFSPKLFGGLTAIDIGRRFAGPMADLWTHPYNLRTDEQRFGNNIGSALFDYPLVAGGGFIGGRLGALASAAAADQPLAGELSLSTRVQQHTSLIGRLSVNAPLIFSANTLETTLNPASGDNPSFPHSLRVSPISQYKTITPGQDQPVVPESGFHLSAKQQTSTFGINVASAGNARLDIAAEGPGTNWRQNNAESAVMSVYIDGKYSSDVVLWDGAHNHKYAIALGALAPGHHTITLRYAPEKSSPDAHGVTVTAGTAGIEQYKSPVDKWIHEYSPIFYGRHGLDNNHTDTPLGMMYWVSNNSDGTTDINYAVAFSNEDGGNATEPALEQALWGRLTDLQSIADVKVDKQGRLISVNYCAGGPSNQNNLPFHGKFQGTHPLLMTANLHNDQTDTGSGPLRFALPPDHRLPDNLPESDIMQENPLWFSIEEKELYREDKIDTNGKGDVPSNSSASAFSDWLKLDILGDHFQMADPRRYVYVQFEGHNAENGPLAAKVLLKDGTTLYSDFSKQENAIGLDGWQQTAVLLPPGTQPDDVRHVSFVSRGKHLGSVVAVGHVFTLDAHNNPVDLSSDIVSTQTSHS